MRKCAFVPMITLSLLLCGCGGDSVTAEGLRGAYRDMAGCAMEASVSCTVGDALWEARMRCEYVQGGKSTVEVLAPETIAGVRAVVDEETWYLEYGGAYLDAGPVSREEISPAACLPRMMNALREGWLAEENPETLEGVPCLRLTVDQTGVRAEKVYTTLWLRQEDGTPVRGEITVDGERVLTAEFTAFSFSDTPGEG